MKVPFINNVDKSFVNDIKTIISEAPGVFQSDKNRLIAWLEKQVEQKAQGKSILEAIKEEKVDNANKEFVDKGYEDGDWVVNNNGKSQFYQVITRSWPDSKIKGAEDNLELFINTATLDKQYHLWTIRDAREGDVLALSYASQNHILIYKGLYEKSFKTMMSVFCSYCVEEDTYYDETDSFHVMNCGEIITPATKEQRDTLIKAMADAGYTFDFEKKELKKIEKKPANTVKPKFREGDSIQFKGFGHNRYTIKEVCGLSHYINTMGNRMDMSYTDANFEVIKDAEKRNEQKPYGQRQECIDCQFNYADTCKGYCAMKRGEHKPTDKVEPKFRVKYAGSEYNVIEVKEIAGIIFYGIEDEPHHIDYVLPDHCDIISGYGVKEKGNPYPTESAIFLEQNTALSEEDEKAINITLHLLTDQLSENKYPFLSKRYVRAIKILESLKERVQPQNMWISVDKEVYIKEPVLAQKKDKSDLFKGYVICCDHVLVPNVYERYIRLDNYCPQFTWKPSDDQMEALERLYWIINPESIHSKELASLLKQLKKLRE